MVIGTLALLFCFFVIYSFPMERLVSRAAAPEGRCPIECRGYFVHPYVRTYVRLSVRMSSLQGLSLLALASASGSWP